MCISKPDLYDLPIRGTVFRDTSAAGGNEIGECPKHGTYYGKSCPLCRTVQGVDSGVPAVATESGSFV